MQLIADDHGVRNHRRRLIDHALVGQSAAIRIFGVAGVNFMRKVVRENGPKERVDLDSKQQEEVQAGRDGAAAGGDMSDPAEVGTRCSEFG